MTATPLGSAVGEANQSLGRPFDQVEGWELLRCRIAAKIRRLRRWEYWPTWSIYLPILPYIGYLAIRHRGLSTCALANPGIPLGGLIGESKWEILRLLPESAIVPTALIPPGQAEDRLNALKAVMGGRSWNWPLILKPDVGERGSGVERVRSLEHARRYLEDHPERILAQTYHPGPFEAGVFYVRIPGENAGQIFSITDKQFAMVVGDGRSSIRSLVWRHERYRAQASVFLQAIGSQADRVPDVGEPVQIGFMGNHCRGSLFLDGAGLATPELTSAIDAIARQTPGFYFGRFDIRYADVDQFMAGRNFQIVELNGLMSESTNIYDPRTRYLQGQRILRHQWRLAFLAGAASRRLGAKAPSLWEAARACVQHVVRGRRDHRRD